MKRYYILMLFVLQTLILAIAQERKFYAGHLFLESKWKDCKDGKYGLSIVQLDSALQFIIPEQKMIHLFIIR